MNNSKIMLEKILQNIQNIGITEKECLKSCGINTSFLTDWKNEKIKNPSVDKIIKLAVFLNIDLYDLFLGKSPAVINLNEKEKKLLNNYNCLNDEDKIRVSERAETLAELAAERASKERASAQAKKTANPIELVADELPPEPTAHSIAYYDYPASAGTGLFLDETTAEKITVVRTPESLRADFAIPIKGDSMEPDFSSGDIVLVESCPCVSRGEVGIFVLDGDAFIKEFGGDRLISHNGKYAPLMLKEYESAVCMGRVLGKAEIIK